MPAIFTASNLRSALSVLAALCAVATASPEPPPLDEAVDAWVTARAWVDDLRVPEVPVVPPAPDAPRDHGAVAVVLRLHGRLVGTGVDFGPSAGRLHRATARAIEEARRNDAVTLLAAEGEALRGGNLSMELELAAPPVPIPGRSVAQIIARVEPALDAIALRRGERWAWTMPSVAQASNIAYDPARTCVALLRELAIDPRDLPTQELPDSVAFYRAETRRLAQRRPDEAPFEVLRGREVIPLAALGPRGRTDFAQALARHLDAHIVRPSPEAPAEAATLRQLGIRGDYRPHLDMNPSLAAPPRDQALAAFALAAFAGMRDAPLEAREHAAASAAHLLAALAEVAEIEEDPFTSPPAVALALLAACELADAPVDVAPAPADFTARLREALRSRLAEPEEPDHTRALELAAAAALDAAGEPILPRDELLRRLDDAWHPETGSTLVGTLPWLLMAERSLGAFGDAARAARIRDRAVPLRNALGATQLGVGGPEERAPDAAGGFALAGPSGTAATSQSARPALALAIMLGEPSLTTPAERTDAMRSQLMALRFLRQLTVDDRSSYAFRDREKSIGGVTEALWDCSQPVAATAMTLLAVVESEPALRTAAGHAVPTPQD